MKLYIGGTYQGRKNGRCGRTPDTLAQASESVTRVVCGIGVRK